MMVSYGGFPTPGNNHCYVGILVYTSQMASFIGN